MQIAIIEDEKAHADLLDYYIQKWGKERKILTSVSFFDTAEQFWFQWEDFTFDVLFVDIQMPGINGMELAKKVRMINSKIVIVFTTGVVDYLEEGYEVSALRYLVKPIGEGKITDCLDAILEQYKPERYLLVHTVLDEIQKISEETVNYIEAMGHGSVIGIAYQGRLEVRESLSFLEQMVGGEGNIAYQKCHRSYLCRIANVRRIDREMVYFDDGSKIPVSRRMYMEVNRAFIDYFRRG